MTTSLKAQKKLSDLLTEVLAVARENDIAVLISAVPKSRDDNQVSSPDEIVMVSHLPAHAPGRMAAARTLLTIGSTVFNQQSIIGDRITIKVNELESTSN
jgi:hypothetical protein